MWDWRNTFLRPNPPPVLHELKSPLFWVTSVVLMVFSQQLEHLWPFEYAGFRSREILLHGIPKHPSEYTRIVAVTADYYDKEVGNDCVTGDKLLGIVRGLLKYNPAVLVVDFDTSSKKYAPLLVPPDGVDASLKDIPVVWARNADEIMDPQGRLQLEPLPLLGTMTPIRAPNWGYALFPDDRDWTVRPYRRTFEVGGVH